MNDFMELKAKTLKLCLELAENPVPGLKKRMEEEIETINKLLLKQRLEESRRFGIFFMQFFQTAMEATKKSIAFKVKKMLSISWKNRLNLLMPLVNDLDELVNNGVVYLQLKTTSLTVCEVGFLKLALHTNNSVRSLDKFNCKICNRKLDPIYIDCL